MQSRQVEVDIRADADAVSEAAAHRFLECGRDAIARRGRYYVALAGGSTPRKTYRLLTETARRSLLDWQKVEFFFGDERSVSPDHADSNFRMAREMLLSPLAISEKQIHRMPAEESDLAAAARAYEQELAAVFGRPHPGPPPAFDLILVGMGADGHTLSLFPNTAALGNQTDWVVANEVPQLNTWRMTLTATLAKRARQVLFVTAGAEKAPALKQVLEGDYQPQQYPSQLISGRKVTWLVDTAAAAELSAHPHPRSRAIGPVRLAPSILAADFTCLGDQIRAAEAAGADRLHVDVMDGHFVPNISFGPLVAAAARRVSRLPIECHLMISDPDQYLDAFVAAGADSILVHCEEAPHLHRTLQQIRAAGKKCGVVLNPSTPVSMIREVIGDVDLVLAMTVNPGFGGQKFIESMLPKITEIRELIEDENPLCELEVDGGIDVRTAPRAVDAGATVLVAGSAIFGAADGIAAASQRILSAC